MFGIDILSASLLPAALVALAAGVLSFLSPCVLPIVPPYLAYMSGISVGELKSSRKALLAASFFVLGLSTVFILMGAVVAGFGAAYLAHSQAFANISAIVVMIFGAHFIGVFRLKFLDQDIRMDAGDRGGSAFGAYILGLAFAFGWTPCQGPQLGAILTLAANQASVGSGMTLLAVYALGLGIPFLLVAAFFSRLSPVLAFMKSHMQQIERIMGLLLWTIGLMMLTGGFSEFSRWLVETLPPELQFG